MRRPTATHSILLLLILLACSSRPGALHAQSEQPHQLVLLDNGELLSGFVRRDADMIVLTTERGALIRIPDRRVLHFANDKMEAFQFLQQAADSGNCREVLKLARWALQNELFESCGAELSRASRIDPTSNELLVLQARLNQARKRSVHEQAASSGRTHIVATAHQNRPPVVPPANQKARQLTAEEALAIGQFHEVHSTLADESMHHGGLPPVRVNGPVLDSDAACRRGFTASQSIANMRSLLQFVDLDSPGRSKLIATLRAADAHLRFVRQPGTPALPVWNRGSTRSNGPAEPVSNVRTRAQLSMQSSTPKSVTAVSVSTTSGDPVAERSNDPTREEEPEIDPYDRGNLQSHVRENRRRMVRSRSNYLVAAMYSLTRDSRISNGIEPDPKTTSWNSRTSNRSPNSTSAS